MEKGKITGTLVDQFRKSWDTLRNLVDIVPDQQWNTGADDYLIPARLAYHIIQAAERYVSELDSEEYLRTRKHNLDWQGPAAELPAKSDFFGDVDWIQKKAEKWLVETGDDGLLQAETLYPHTGQRTLDKALYLLRHNQHHLGEMLAEVRHRGYYKDVWQ